MRKALLAAKLGPLLGTKAGVVIVDEILPRSAVFIIDHVPEIKEVPIHLRGQKKTHPSSWRKGKK
jgi:hypothetical protein